MLWYAQFVFVSRLITHLVSPSMECVCVFYVCSITQVNLAMQQTYHRGGRHSSYICCSCEVDTTVTHGVARVCFV